MLSLKEIKFMKDIMWKQEQMIKVYLMEIAGRSSEEEKIKQLMDFVAGIVNKLDNMAVKHQQNEDKNLDELIDVCISELSSLKTAYDDQEAEELIEFLQIDMGNLLSREPGEFVKTSKKRETEENKNVK
ncbi:MAG: hypothetical protein PWQ97_470 [Tepidanaerobacteraceae bacterium]|nr:hypothetical protein [Tepidanaerobacteraceae bacterium]